MSRLRGTWTGTSWRLPAGIDIGAAPSATTILSSTLESAALQTPIATADMYRFLGQSSYGGASNFVRTGVVNALGRGKVLNQHFTAGQYSPSDGIALTGSPLPASYDEASIEYDVRFVSAGVPWGWGGKLPGLGGVRPGFGNPPTGGQSSQNGWTGRSMWITPSAGFGSENPKSPVEWIGYIYDPTQGAGSFGQNRRTGKSFIIGQWHRIKQSYKMNTIATEGSTPNADGVHRMWFDGELVFQKTNQVYRYFEAGRITHLVWDMFYGGNTASWAPAADTDIQVDNLLITSP